MTELQFPFVKSRDRGKGTKGGGGFTGFVEGGVIGGRVDMHEIAESAAAKDSLYLERVKGSSYV